MADQVSVDQANEALSQLMGGAASEQAPEQPEPAETAAEPEAAEAGATTTEAEPETPTEDVGSLRKRMADLEADYKAKAEAMERRYSQSQEILTNRWLQKSTAADRALKALAKAKSEEGLDPTEADRVIAELQGTMNPASPSYAPVKSEPQGQDNILTLNRFLNEKQMSEREAEEFGAWIQSDAPKAMTVHEQAIANRDVEAFLRLAHGRFLEGAREKEKERLRNDAVGAVKSVQRTQREVARAASTGTRAPTKQPAGKPAEVDVKTLTKADISDLLRQSVTQYR